VVASFEEDGGISEMISGTNYNLPYGSSDNNVVLRISVPANANIGDSYNIDFSVSAPPIGEGGTLQLSLKYGVSFPVEVIEEPTDVPPAADEPAPPEKTKGNKILKMLVVLIALILIVWIILKKKSN